MDYIQIRHIYLKGGVPLLKIGQKALSGWGDRFFTVDITIAVFSCIIWVIFTRFFTQRLKNGIIKREYKTFINSNI
jgi:hypothetical protein